MSSANSGPFALQPNAPHNAPLVQYENDLLTVASRLRDMSETPHRTIEETRSQLLRQVHGELERIEAIKESEWNRQRAGQLTRPIRRYQHQKMKAWVGRLLCRADLQDMFISMDTAMENLEMHDICDGPALKGFLGPDSLPFWTSSPSETRIGFGLAVDGFNPYQSKTAKQNVTSTAIYMICLNLPLHLRYLPENMYLVGVIP
ncbi:hypothetical protein C8Q73DRAFT_660308, partial [Cubamyces lactineus]